MGYQEALEAAGAEVLAFEQFGNYQGTWWARCRKGGAEFWVTGYFGSCSGCDAFEGEFGYGTENCEQHRYTYSPVEECGDCAKEKEKYRRKLADFGNSYLDFPKTQEVAEEEASKNLSWDMDATKELEWLRSNAIST